MILFIHLDTSFSSIMADKNKEGRQADQQVANVAEEAQNIDATDDFDPFSGVVECYEEKVDSNLFAPPENE